MDIGETIAVFIPFQIEIAVDFIDENTLVIVFFIALITLATDVFIEFHVAMRLALISAAFALIVSQFL